MENYVNSTNTAPVDSQAKPNPGNSVLVSKYLKIGKIANFSALSIMVLLLASAFLPFFKYPILENGSKQWRNVLHISKHPITASLSIFVSIIFVALVIGILMSVWGIFNNKKANAKINHVTISLHLTAFVYFIFFTVICTGIVFACAFFMTQQFDLASLLFSIIFAIGLIVAFTVRVLLLVVPSKKLFISENYSSIKAFAKSKKNNYLVSCNSLVLFVEGLISCVLAALYIILIQRINSEGFGLIKADAGLYICAVLACIGALFFFFVLGYLASIKKSIAKDQTEDDIFTHKHASFSVGDTVTLIISCIIFIWSIGQKPVWKATMHMKADDIALEMTKQELKDMLGNPSVEDGNKWYYFDKAFEKKYNNAIEALENSGDDLDVAFEAMQSIDGQKHTVIELVFDEDEKVSCVTYGRNRIYNAYDNDDERITQIDSLKFIDSNGNEFSAFEVFETTTNAYLITDISQYEAIVQFDEHDFVRKTFNYVGVKKDNGRLFLTISDKYFNTSFEIDADTTTLDENGVCRISDNIEVITTYMFSSYASSIKELYIPSSITKIEKDAFRNFTSLEKVYINDLSKWCAIEFESDTSNPLSYTQKAYINEVELNDIVIPEGTKEISSYAFAKASFLTSVSIPDSVEKIGHNAFSDVSNATQIIDGITYIDGWIIDSNTDVQTLVLNNDIRGIGAGTFEECNTLVSVEIPASVSILPQKCFANCENLKNIIFRGNLKTIDDEAFSNCGKLEKISLTNVTNTDSSLSAIGSKAFYNCAKFEAIEFASDENDDQISNSKTIYFPKSTTSIGQSAFYGCTSLEEIHASSLTYLGDFAFDKCDSIKKLKITSIPDYVGENTIPELAESIHVSAPIANTIKSSHAKEIIIENGDSLVARFNISTLLKSIKIIGVEKVDIILGTITRGSWLGTDEYPKSANTAIYIGKDAHLIKANLSYSYEDKYFVQLEDTGDWSFIKKYSCESVSASELTNSSTFSTVFKNGYLIKGDVDFIKDVCFNENNKSNTFLILFVTLFTLGFVMFFIANAVSVRRKIKRNKKKNKARSISMKSKIISRVLVSLFIILGVTSIGTSIYIFFMNIT